MIVSAVSSGIKCDGGGGGGSDGGSDGESDGDEVPLAGQEGLPGDGPLLVDSLSAGPGVAKQQTSSTSSQQEVLSLFFFLQTLANLVLSMNSTSAN